MLIKEIQDCIESDSPLCPLAILLRLARISTLPEDKVVQYLKEFQCLQPKHDR